MARNKNEAHVEGEVYSYISDGTDEVLIRAGQTRVTGITVYHIDATPVSVKLYNKATAPDENDTPVYRIGVPANAIAANGSGSNIFLDDPLLCPLGLGMRVVTGLADNSDSAVTSAEVIVNVHYTEE
jgi:hypothetical protein